MAKNKHQSFLPHKVAIRYVINNNRKVVTFGASTVTKH